MDWSYFPFPDDVDSSGHFFDSIDWHQVIEYQLLYLSIDTAGVRHCSACPGLLGQLGWHFWMESGVIDSSNDVEKNRYRMLLRTVSEALLPLFVGNPAWDCPEESAVNLGQEIV
jgi:hypothetical protein